MAVISTNAYGDLDLQSYAYRYWQGSDNSTWGYAFTTDKGNYVFLPDDFISKGFVANNKQYYSSSFTNKSLLSELYTKYQPLDFGGFKDFEYGDKLYTRLKEMGYSTSGVLVPESWVSSNILSNNAMKTYDLGRSAGNVTVGAIQGMGEKDGQMVYVPQVSGADQAAAYILGSQTYATWMPELKWYQRLAKDIAKIPLFPEIAAIATTAMGGASYAPYVYAALKGATLGAQGVDPLKAGLMVGINLGAQVLATNTDFAKSIGASFGATDAATQLAVGKAVIGAGANGIRASLAGGDVTQAMLDGALTAGAGATVAGLSKSALGSGYQDIISKISNSTNLTSQQVQTMIASSLVSGITSEIKGGDFGTTFKNSLISSGVGQSLANEVSSVVGDNVSPDARAAIAKGTAVVAGTATNALLNNQDITKALEANLPATIYSTMTAYNEQKNRESSAKAAGWADYSQQQAARSTFGEDITPARFQQETDARAAGWADYSQQQAARSQYGSEVTPDIYKKEVAAKAEGWDDFGQKISAQSKYGSDITPLQFDIQEQAEKIASTSMDVFGSVASAEPRTVTDVGPSEAGGDDYTIHFDDGSSITFNRITGEIVDVTPAPQEQQPGWQPPPNAIDNGDNTYTVFDDSGSSITYDANGNPIDFTPSPDEPKLGWQPPPNAIDNGDGTYTLIDDSGSKMIFDSDGNPIDYVSAPDETGGYPTDPYEVDNIGNRDEEDILTGNYNFSPFGSFPYPWTGSTTGIKRRQIGRPASMLRMPSSSTLSPSYVPQPTSGYTPGQESTTQTSPDQSTAPGLLPLYQADMEDITPYNPLSNMSWAQPIQMPTPTFFTGKSPAAYFDPLQPEPQNQSQDSQYAEGGLIDHDPQFYSEGGASLANRYVKGDGDGTSDSVPAMLASGEFVIPADVVSALGNGDNDAGAGVLDQFMAAIRKHKRSASPDRLPPDSRGPLAYLNDAMKKGKHHGRT